jgi:hypothetical protein
VVYARSCIRVSEKTSRVLEGKGVGFRPFRDCSAGHIYRSVLLGRRARMYWYNPTSRTSERVAAPANDDEAVRMLAGHPDSARFVGEYAELRRSGAPIERALVLVGHEERLREHELAPMRLAWRERPGRRSRPSAVGYELLVAQRLGEESGNRQRGHRRSLAGA